MNNRIRELIDEAVRFRLDPDSNAYEALVHPEDLEAFAELIVGECVLHLHKRGVEGFGILEERKLKEHFGVE